jgi:DNA topoisomerase 2-associated protein PAT1
VEEVELGGLDDDDDAAFIEHEDEENPLYGRDNMLEVV